MEIKINKIISGIGIKSIYKNEHKNLLSKKETEEAYEKSPFYRILENVVEILEEAVFNNILLRQDEGLINALYGKERRRDYACSIYAGKTSVIRVFESYLSGEQTGMEKIPEENIKRIGLCGFQHYFVECKKQKQLSSLREGIMMFSREKVIDVIKQNYSPPCSIASSFRQIK